MRKISIVTLAAALLLSGCNKENLEFNDVENLFIESEGDVRFIKLGGRTDAAVTTRASVESLDEIGQVGIFCLAARKTDVKNAEEAKAIDWNQIVSTNPELYGTTTNGIYWGNVCCDVVNNGGTYAIEPTDAATYYPYYPMTSWFGYDFYGYHPFSNSYSKSTDSVYVDMVIDGTQDVIWGRSDIPNVAELTSSIELQDKLSKCYYSARYFRNHPQDVEAAHMKFEHKLARFRFFVYPGANKESAEDKLYDEAAALCVKEIRLNKVEDKLRLVVADRSGRNRGGELYSNNRNVTSFYLHHKDGSKLADRPIDVPVKEDSYGVTYPDTAQVGDCIMALPGHTAYYMSVVLADTADHSKTYSSEKNITISLNAAKTKKFEAGKTYNVYLRVAGVTMIGVTAELEDWDPNGEDLEFIEFN